MLARPAHVVDRLFRAKHDYLPGTTIFRDIDLELLVRELNLEALGERDGAAGVPAADSKAETATEKAIARRVRSYWDEAVQGARRAHDRYAGRWTSLTPETEIDTLIGDPGAVRSSLMQMARQDLAELQPLRDAVVAQREALVRFTAREKIDRPPNAPASMAIKVLVLLVAFGIELGINVSAFAAGEEFGIAGALMKVIAFPLFNFGITGVLVYFIGRQVMRPGWGRKAWGALGFAAAVTWVVVFNLLIAHWRDSLATAMTLEAGRQAWQSLLSDPWGLRDANSWLLLVAGAVAGGLGGYEAWILKDPHPGYTDRVLARDAAERNYTHRHGWAMSRIQRLAAERTEKLRGALLKAETAHARRPELAAQVNSLAEDLDNYRRHLEATAEDLAIRYREANIRARSAPPPASFDRPLQLGLATPTLAPLGRPGEREIAGLLAQAMAQITAAQDEACAQLPTLKEADEARPA